MNRLKEYLEKEAQFIGEETISIKTLLKLIKGFKEDCLHGDFKIINGVFQCTHCGKPYMETGQLDILKFISDCRLKVDAEVPFGKEDAYDAIINEVDKHK